MLFLISTIIILTTSLFLSATLQFKSKLRYLLSISLFSFTNVVLTGHLGHTFSLLNSQLFYLVVEITLFVIAGLVWKKYEKPNLVGPFENLEFKSLSDFAQKNLDLILLILGVGVSLGICASLAYRVAPNNNDSVSTHIVRVIYWLQHGNFSPWFTSRSTQLVYPVNPGLAILWTILFSGSDHWAAFIQLLSGVVASLTVMGIARELGAKKNAALFSGLIFLTYPIVTLQTTTTQTGLVSAALFGVSFYFFISGIKHQQLVSLILSGLSLGLALGSKQTIFFLLPGWGIAILIIWLVYRQINFKQFASWAVSVLVTFLLLGAQIFYITYQRYGSPLGPSGSVSQATSGFQSPSYAISQVGMNSTRFLYQSLDPSGLPSPLWRWGVKARTFVGHKVFSTLNIPIESELYVTPYHNFSLDTAASLQEDEAWYGILGFMALVPTTLWAFVVYLKKKEPITLSIFLIAVGFFIVLALFRPGWDPYQGRYFLPVMLLVSSLIALWFSKPWMRWAIGPLSVMVGLLILFNATLFNAAKPLITNPDGFYYRYPEDPGYEQVVNYSPIISKDWSYQVTYQTKRYQAICELIDEYVPSDAILAYSMNRNYYQEYCYFGPALERRLIPQPYGDEVDTIDEQALLDAGVQYIYFENYDYDQIPEFQYFEWVATEPVNNGYLFEISQ